MRQSEKLSESETSLGGSNDAPHLNEIEVSVFGPGYGESILIHVGDNEWFIVDSCVTPSKEPAPLVYLRQIGVDPAISVRQVVATHWHDDHVKGIAKTFRACSSSEIVFSEALKPNEFLTIVEAYSKRGMMESSGVQELGEIIETLKERKKSPKFAIADRCLWKNAESALGSVEVHSLSPSDASIVLSKMEIANLVPHEKRPKERVIAQGPNHTAVVLWIKIQDIAILLGSDLENSTNTSRGWIAILDSTTKPDGRAQIMKIAHHGSLNGDNLQIWTDMLTSDPIAVLTPFVNGNVYLPTENDCARISSRTSNAYATAPPLVKKKKGRPQVVEKMLAETVISIREIAYSTGQVRLRLKPTEKAIWDVALLGDAKRVETIYPLR